MVREDRVIDTLTGLPELPPNYFWRIGTYRRYYYQDSYHKVFGVTLCLVERGIFGRRKVVEISQAATTTDVENIRQRASMLWAEHSKVIERLAQQSALRGDYPPKKLEVK